MAASSRSNRRSPDTILVSAEEEPHMRNETSERDGSRDFDFWIGRWRIRNERLVKRLQACTEWETFEATVEARFLPGGLGNVEEFHTEHCPGFVGMPFGFNNSPPRQWSIYWASNQTG